MAKYQILYWGEIPAQVKAFDGARPVSRPLPERYQVAIDRRAMQQGLAGSDAYLDQWRWSPRLERPGSTAEVLDAICQELLTEWDPKIAHQAP
jgi:hypothetical protein